MSETQKQRDRFAHLLINKLKSSGETRRLKYDEKEFSLTAIGTDGRSEVEAHLGNAHKQYMLHDDAGQEEFLRGYVQRWFDASIMLPEQFTDAKRHLYPYLKSRAYFADKHCLQHSLIGEHLALGVVYDMPRAVLNLTDECCTTWGVTESEITDITQQNLLRLPEPSFDLLRPGVYISSTGDGYDATRITLPDYIRALSLIGSPIAMPLTPNTVIVTGSVDVEGVVELGQRAMSYVKKLPHLISSLAFRLTDDNTWAAWLPPMDHPGYVNLKHLQIHYFGSLYAEQYKQLSRAASGMVSPYVVAVSRNDINLGSACVLCPTDVPMSCPTVDHILFKRLDQECVVDWQAALEILGEAASSEDVYPPRTMFHSFPTDDQWQKLKVAERVVIAEKEPKK